MAPDAPVSLPLGARCASHPEAPAVATCTRCGTFLCGACTELSGEDAFCASCLRLYQRAGPAPRIVQGLIVLGIAGLVCSPVTFALGGLPPLISMVSAGLALTVARGELRRIARDEAPLRGRTQARVAFALGLVNLIPSLLWVAMVGLLLWRGLSRAFR